MNEITVADLLNSLTSLLVDKLESPRLDIEVLIAFGLNWPRVKLYSDSDHILSDHEQQQIAELINRRLNGEPIAYITGHQEFWSLQLVVSPATLIPRPETEHLVEETLKKLPKAESRSIVDLGTGSGAIALSVARDRPKCHVTAVDISYEALSVAARNVKFLGLGNVKLVQGDWFENLQGKRFDIIVSNPPYVAEGDLHLEKGDVVFEPRTALSSGKDGMTAITTIISKAKEYMHDSAWLLIEHGFQQADAVRALMEKYNFHAIETIKDLAGHERITFAQK